MQRVAPAAFGGCGVCRALGFYSVSSCKHLASRCTNKLPRRLTFFTDFFADLRFDGFQLGALGRMMNCVFILRLTMPRTVLNLCGGSSRQTGSWKIVYGGVHQKQSPALKFSVSRIWRSKLCMYFSPVVSICESSVGFN